MNSILLCQCYICVLTIHIYLYLYDRVYQRLQKPEPIVWKIFQQYVIKHSIFLLGNSEACLQLCDDGTMICATKLVFHKHYTFVSRTWSSNALEYLYVLSAYEQVCWGFLSHRKHYSITLFYADEFERRL